VLLNTKAAHSKDVQNLNLVTQALAATYLRHTRVQHELPSGARTGVGCSVLESKSA